MNGCLKTKEALLHLEANLISGAGEIKTTLLRGLLEEATLSFEARLLLGLEKLLGVLVVSGAAADHLGDLAE